MFSLFGASKDASSSSSAHDFLSYSPLAVGLVTLPYLWKLFQGPFTEELGDFKVTLGLLGLFQGVFWFHFTVFDIFLIILF